jgi:hypothetical protein
MFLLKFLKFCLRCGDHLGADVDAFAVEEVGSQGEKKLPSSGSNVEIPM